MAWGKAGSTTLTSAGDALTQSTISNSNTYIYLYHAIPSGELTEYMTMGSGGTKDTGSNYSNRVNTNGASSDSEFFSRANIVNASKSGATKPEFGIGYGVNLASEEKLIMTYHSNVSSAGAGTAPDRNEAVGKHKQVSAVLDTISFDNTGSGDFAVGSTLCVLGSEMTPATAVPAIDNVQDNSLFIEKENARRYWFTSEVNNLTFEDDFSGADNWSKSPSDSQFAVDTSDDRLEFLENASSGGDRCWYDLGADAVSSTKWLFRAKFRFTTIATQSDYPEFDFGLSDNTVNSDTQQNFMGFRCLPMSTNNLFRPRVCDGGSGDSGKPRRGASASYNPSPAFTTGTDYYVEIKRTSASNWSCTLSTTNAFDGDIVGGSFTDASGVTDLRYIKIMDGTTATSGDMAGYVDDVEFYNNATTPTEPATWLTSSGISKTGCLAHYNFEDTGNTLTNLATTTRGFTDGLGSSANGTNGGATQSQTGVVDNAWSFDNSNDYVNTNISTVVMDTPKTFSISMWIKPNSSSDWSDVLVGQSVGTSDQGMVLWLNSLKPTLYLEGSGGGSTVGLYAPANTVSTGVWNHVVITVVGQSSRASDATGINIYLNGTSQTISTSGSSGTVGTMGVNANMFLGSKHGTTGFFDGLMDEVSIWNRVLTQAEVTTLYNSGKGVGV